MNCGGQFASSQWYVYTIVKAFEFVSFYFCSSVIKILLVFKICDNLLNSCYEESMLLYCFEELIIFVYDRLWILISFGKSGLTMAKRILSYLSMKFYCHVHCVPLTSKMMLVVTACSCRTNSFKKDLMYFQF